MGENGSHIRILELILHKNQKEWYQLYFFFLKSSVIYNHLGMKEPHDFAQYF